MAEGKLKVLVDISGLAPLHAMCQSLGEALANIEFEALDEFDICGEGGDLAFRGTIIARNDTRVVLEQGAALVKCRAIPTPAMPLFVTAVTAIAPIIKVSWNGGWPRFSASPGDGETDPEEPLPTFPVDLELV